VNERRRRMLGAIVVLVVNDGVWFVVLVWFVVPIRDRANYKSIHPRVVAASRRKFPQEEDDWPRWWTHAATAARM
jgi:hypothetical protein